ncbi:MAG: hypothetical protein IJ387_06665 [Thermoguttaceae bacterium]|nr:hypothetical protein [Thermoguttaceae bacterium]
MKLQQISVFLENKPGRLMEACAALSDAGVNVETMSLVEAGEFGVLRVLAKNPDAAFEALKGRFTAKKTDALAVQIADEPGALTNLLGLIAANDGLNVEYMYGFTSKKRGVAAIVLSMNDVDRALEVLQAANVALVGADDLFA